MLRFPTIALALTALSAIPAAAQHDMAHMAMGVSALAHKQIDSVAHAAHVLTTPAAATAAGYKPVFGWIPTMGEHWVDESHMTKAAQSSLATPDNLMFSRINGRDSLVGAAFAYVTAAGDTAVPKLFDGTPPWHEHPDLAPAGQTIVMLHVWFVPSPDGPFAGTNPNLPFWAVGLAAPDSTRMHDAAFATMVRRASLALGDLADSSAIFPLLSRRPDIAAAVKPHRDSVRALVEQFRGSQDGKNPQVWARAAEQTAAQWDAILGIYRSAARTDDVRARIDRRVATLMGEHAH